MSKSSKVYSGGPRMIFDRDTHSNVEVFEESDYCFEFGSQDGNNNEHTYSSPLVFKKFNDRRKTKCDFKIFMKSKDQIEERLEFKKVYCKTE